MRFTSRMRKETSKGKKVAKDHKNRREGMRKNFQWKYNETIRRSILEEKDKRGGQDLTKRQLRCS